MMRHKGLLKQGLAVLLSFSLSMGICAAPVLAETGSAETGMETSAEAVEEIDAAATDQAPEDNDTESEQAAETDEAKSEQSVGTDVAGAEQSIGAADLGAGQTPETAEEEYADTDRTDVSESAETSQPAETEAANAEQEQAGETAGTEEEPAEDKQESEKSAAIDTGEGVEEGTSSEEQSGEASEETAGTEEISDVGEVDDATDAPKESDGEAVTEAAEETELTDSVAETEKETFAPDQAGDAEKETLEKAAANANEKRRFLQAELEDMVLSAVFDNDVLPENAVMEAEKEEGTAYPAYWIRFLDPEGREIEADFENSSSGKGELYFVFSAISSPDPETAVLGMEDLESEPAELEKVKDPDELLKDLDMELIPAEGAVLDDAGENLLAVKAAAPEHALFLLVPEEEKEKVLAGDTLLTDVMDAGVIVSEDGLLLEPSVLEAASVREISLLSTKFSGTFYTETAPTILNRINEIRKEACREGIQFKAGTPLTMSDYVEIRWSSDLEKIARQRAAEACVYMGHTRPDGSAPFELTSGGVTTQAENLAWNGYAQGTLMHAIEQWYEEKEDLKSGNRMDAGHYISLINPNYKFIGLGAYNVDNTYFSTTAAEFSSKNGLNEKKDSFAGKKDVTMSVPASRTELLIKGYKTFPQYKTQEFQLLLDVTYPDVYGDNLTTHGVPGGSVTWKSSDSETASVDGTGKVTGLKKGTATISVDVEGGKRQGAFQVTITDPDPVESFVKRLYSGCFGRAADQGGLDFWVSSLKNNKTTGAKAAMFFFESGEMQKQGLSDEEFINRLYTVMMGRAADAGGRNYWLEKVQNGMSRRWLIKSFIDSKEFTNVCADYGITKGSVSTTENRDKNYGVTSFIARLYTKALDRKYDTGGLNYWTGYILSVASAKRKAEMINVAVKFLHSKEFTDRNLNNTEYLKVLYRTFFGREADKGGLEYWLGSLNSGKSTRDSVLKSFAYSGEFARLMQQYGIQ